MLGEQMVYLGQQNHVSQKESLGLNTAPMNEDLH